MKKKALNKRKRKLCYFNLKVEKNQVRTETQKPVLNHHKVKQTNYTRTIITNKMMNKQRKKS